MDPFQKKKKIATRAEKPLLQRYVVANESNIQKASSDNCGYDLRIEHQK